MTYQPAVSCPRCWARMDHYGPCAGFLCYICPRCLWGVAVTVSETGESVSCQETMAIETEMAALEAEAESAMVGATPSVAASWRLGARYALAWVINRRGAEMGPAAAAREFVGPYSRQAQTKPEGT